METPAVCNCRRRIMRRGGVQLDAHLRSEGMHEPLPVQGVQEEGDLDDLLLLLQPPQQGARLA